MQNPPLKKEKETKKEEEDKDDEEERRRRKEKNLRAPRKLTEEQSINRNIVECKVCKKRRRKNI